MSEVNPIANKTTVSNSDYIWRYEYYDDEPVSFEGLKAHKYSIVIGFWVGLAVFVIFMFFVLTLLTKTGAPHPESCSGKCHRPKHPQLLQTLPSFHIKSEVEMLAVDCTMFSTTQDSSILQPMSICSKTWMVFRLGLKSGKCQPMIIFNKQESNPHPMTFNGITAAESPIINIWTI
ncbi:melanocortin-2 receptor accessory protein 2A isoform X3 [Scyliorhinus canicula]|uniref:melanocortin-2 receptor accessory protein 2A isoform X3 n=1 Tax=Scyliorhinus canicula TaxID=7830 RepID=UPI0018F334E0|nr:melanocortin-2 receptor accessory protein 2A isoform X3 [Scyliorhinus canicula]